MERIKGGGVEGFISCQSARAMLSFQSAETQIVHPYLTLAPQPSTSDKTQWKLVKQHLIFHLVTLEPLDNIDFNYFRYNLSPHNAAELFYFNLLHFYRASPNDLKGYCFHDNSGLHPITDIPSVFFPSPSL